jgi:hypothetical protein
MKASSSVSSLLLMPSIIAWILTAVIAIDIGIAMLFLIWDMYKKIKKMVLRGLQIVRQAKKYVEQKYPQIQIL